MQCANNDPTRIGHGQAKSHTGTPKTSSIPPKPPADQQNSHRICANCTKIETNRAAAQTRPSTLQSYAHNQTNDERYRRRRVGEAEIVYVPRHSSCERREARSSRGRRGPWRAPRTATAAAPAATVRRRHWLRRRGKGRPSLDSPRRRRSWDPNPRLPPPGLASPAFRGLIWRRKGAEVEEINGRRNVYGTRIFISDATEKKEGADAVLWNSAVIRGYL